MRSFVSVIRPGRTTAKKRESYCYDACRLTSSGLAALTLLMGSCVLLPQPPIDAPVLHSPVDFPVTEYLKAASGTVYEISRGELLIRIYRGGWLSGLAHNHVISTDTIRGYALIEGPQGDRAALYIRPWDLVLDDPAQRLAAGAGFESQRSAGDVAATRTRMLGPHGLHSNAYPFIIARIRPSVDWRTATIDLEFGGEGHRLTVPIRRVSTSGRMIVETEIVLSHAALGLKPYSAFAGAIGVADRIDLRARIEIEVSAGRRAPVNDRF